MDAFIIQIYWPLINMTQYASYYGGSNEKALRIKWIIDQRFDCKIICIFNIKFKKKC